MRRTVNIIIALPVLLVIIGGLLLPNLTFAVQDVRTVGIIEVEDAQAVSFEANSDMTVVDRMLIAVNSPTLQINNGRMMDADMAFERVIEELSKLEKDTFFDIEPTEFEMSSYEIYYQIDADDPTRNMVTWYMYLTTETVSLLVAIDDETGIILRLGYFDQILAEKYNASMTYLARSVRADQIAMMIAPYYGLDAERIEPEEHDSTGVRVFAEHYIRLGSEEHFVDVPVEVYDYGFLFNVGYGEYDG